MGAAASVPDRAKADELGLTATARNVVAAARMLAKRGTGEKTAAHGAIIGLVPRSMFEFIFAINAKGFPEFGKISDSSYDYRGKGVKLDSPEGWKKLQICAREDGMIIVDEDNNLVCGNYFVRDTREGDNDGGHGARHLAASAFAEKLQTLAIKVSEDMCGHNELQIADAKMMVFHKTNQAVAWPVHPQVRGERARARARRAAAAPFESRRRARPVFDLTLFRARARARRAAPLSFSSKPGDQGGRPSRRRGGADRGGG